MIEPHQNEERALFGFWLYILSDCVLFAGLFAVFAVLRGETYGGPTGEGLLNLPFVLTETVILLASSYAMGLAVSGRKRVFLLIALLLGLLFVGLEAGEFRTLILEGSGPGRSAFLSSYFVLVGTHGLHVLIGALWACFVLTTMRGTRLRMLGLFWHFLDIVWIFIFSIVYLLTVAL